MSKVRYLYVTPNGSAYAGSRVHAAITATFVRFVGRDIPRGTKREQILAMHKAMPTRGALTIVREPKWNAARSSRYIQMVSKYGITERRRRKRALLTRGRRGDMDLRAAVARTIPVPTARRPIQPPRPRMDVDGVEIGRWGAARTVAEAQMNNIAQQRAAQATEPQLLPGWLVYDR